MNPIETIENLPIFIDSRAAMVQVYKGVKPASFVDLEGGYWEVRDLEMPSPEEMEQLKLDVASTGLSCLSRERRIKLKRGLVSIPALYFGKDDESLQRLVNASSDEEFGLAFGFPQTAVDAYIGRIKKHDDRFPDDIPIDVLAFARFVRSADHWREELDTGRVWRDAVRDASPTLYAEYMRVPMPFKR